MVRPSALENSPATPRMSCDHGVGVRTGRRDHFRLGLWRNRRWDSPAKIRIAPDSALEGTGFEPSVPSDTTNLSMSPLVGSPPTEKSERKRTDTRSVGLFPRGTDGSNPVPSSGESVALPELLSRVEKPGFPRGCARWLGDRVGRDAQAALR